MRTTLVALLLVFCAHGVSAGTIASISPAMVKVNSGEWFLTINGTGLGHVAVFDGPAGHFELEVNAVFSGSVVCWVPLEVISAPGYYDLFVRGGTGDSNAVTFEVQGWRVWPLVLFVPESIRFQPIDREGAFVKYEVMAAGGEDPQPVVRCDPESGSHFPMGVTHVLCTATDSYGQKAEAKFDVLVLDQVAPRLSLPEPIVVKAASREGAVVEYKTSAYDDIYGEIAPDCLPRSGSVFPIGITEVSCTATDLDLNVAYGGFTVEVLGDSKPYSLTVEVPDTIYMDAVDPKGAEVKYEVRVSGTDDPNPEVTCTPAPGSLFPIGTTMVVCDAIDFQGARGHGEFTVEVVDPDPPIIEKIVASPDVLNPPDKQIVPVTIEATVFDKLDPAPVCEVFAVTSNENIDLGDSDDPKDYDWSITGPLTLELRAEAETEKRVYTVWVGCSDFYGNRVNTTVDVTVPGDTAKSLLSGSTKRRAVGRKP